ncbi:unnamed protein product [Leptosia nina]|uniref:Uncharacterized protein n=1 Tax=Leptosia nina TaxID=320188 RepID=A0AAV1JZN3_9NEOP
MRTLKGLLTIVECSSEESWQEQLGDIQLALNSTHSRVTGYTPLELMFGIQGSSLEIARISSNSNDPIRIDLETARSNASDNIKKNSSIGCSALQPWKSKVLKNDRYELMHINGSNRMYKYAHENLREVPRGSLGLLEVSENFDTEDDVTACESHYLVHETNPQTDNQELKGYDKPDQQDLKGYNKPDQQDLKGYGKPDQT